MRLEYLIYQRLVWDARFRRAFAQDRTSAIQREFPDYVDSGLFASRALMSGLEEEAYRRLGALHKTSRELFPRGHALLLAHYGITFFEEVLLQFLEQSIAEEGRGKASEILDPFDGYVIGPLLRRTAQYLSLGQSWINGILDYEWAVWQARRVAMGWSPLTVARPLSDGATLVSAEFDLKSLMVELKRLRDAAVGSDIVNWRIRPGIGWFGAVLFPHNGEVMEVAVDQQTWQRLSEAIQEQNLNVSKELFVSDIGFSVEASFLCCSNERLSCGNSAEDLSPVVQPEPH
jgi:hypothetical protein